MKEFIRHIEKLLIRNDFVIIPDLGGFTLHYQSAKITKNSIIPPQTRVGFNVLLNNNDGLLSVEILRSQGISKKEANKIIEEKVGYIKSQIRKKKKITIGRLGVLCLGAENQIMFVPSVRADFLPTNFGLKTIRIKQKEKESTINIELSSRELLKYASALIIFFSLFFSAPKLGEKEIQNYAGINTSISTLFNSTTANLSGNSETKNSELQENANRKEYHIVVSSIEDLSSAQRYCSLLKSKYYTNAHILSTNTGHLIVVESFSSPEIAALYLSKHCHNNQEFKDAWINYKPGGE